MKSRAGGLPNCIPVPARLLTRSTYFHFWASRICTGIMARLCGNFRIESCGIHNPVESSGTVFSQITRYERDLDMYQMYCSTLVPGKQDATLFSLIRHALGVLGLPTCLTSMLVTFRTYNVAQLAQGCLYSYNHLRLY